MSAAQSSLKISLKSVGDLTPHPALRGFPGPTPAAREILKLSIEREGVLEPLMADARGQVYCGRARLEIAEELEIFELPVIVQDVSDPLKVALSGAAFGRARTRTIAALLIFLYRPEIAERTGKRGNPHFQLSHSSQLELTTTYASVSRETGIPREYLTEIGQIRAEATKELWDEFCRIVLEGESSIGEAWRGACGKLGAIGKAGRAAIFGEKNGQLDFFSGLYPRALVSLKTCFAAYEKHDVLRTPMIEQWSGVLENMPVGLLEVNYRESKRLLQQKGKLKAAQNG